MIQFNIDPFDMLMQLNTRVTLLEGYTKELQHNQLELSHLISQQNALIKQCQENEKVLSEAVTTCLLQQQTWLDKRN